MTFLLLQLSDPHIGADWGGPAPEESLRQVVAAVMALPDRPDALVVSGDLAEDGRPEQYELLRELLSPLGLEPHVIPGNCDERGALCEAFGHADRDHVSYAVDLGPMRLVALDSTVPGELRGALDGGRLEWLDAELGRAPEQPTLVAMHHPPFATAMPAYEAIGLSAEDRAGLEAVVGDHPQVGAVVAGHVHRTVVASVAGRPALTAPSTYMQAAATFYSDDLRMTDGPRGFVLHAFDGTSFASHVE